MVLRIERSKMQEIFNFKGQEVRTVTINNEPYFVGKDVADILGYQNGSRDINRHVDEEDKLKYRFGTSGQYREMTIIKEPFPHVSKETCLRCYNMMKMTG